MKFARIATIVIFSLILSSCYSTLGLLSGKGIGRTYNGTVCINEKIKGAEDLIGVPYVLVNGFLYTERVGEVIVDTLLYPVDLIFRESNPDLRKRCSLN